VRQPTFVAIDFSMSKAPKLFDKARSEIKIQPSENQREVAIW
jgi:hypothetical protein